MRRLPKGFIWAFAVLLGMLTVVVSAGRFARDLYAEESGPIECPDAWHTG